MQRRNVIIQCLFDLDAEVVFLSNDANVDIVVVVVTLVCAYFKMTVNYWLFAASCT
jgi:ribosomal protein L7Ae-like RNA K-turn-binding protein